jgi:hypothetical protein
MKTILEERKLTAARFDHRQTSLYGHGHEIELLHRSNTMKTTKTAVVKQSGRKAVASAKTALTVTGRSLDKHVIQFKAKENPCREGTFCHAQIEAVRKANGKTVADAQRILDASKLNPSKRRIEIAWLKGLGLIALKKVA